MLCCGLVWCCHLWVAAWACSSSNSPSASDVTAAALSDVLAQATALGIAASDVYVQEASAQLRRIEARALLAGVLSAPLASQAAAAVRDALHTATSAQLPASELRPAQARLQALLTREKLAAATHASPNDALALRKLMAEAKGRPSSLLSAATVCAVSSD